MDLRKPLINSIVLTGGTAMHPGFCSRFKAELLAALSAAGPSPPPAARRRSTHETRFAGLTGLRDRVAILNDPETGRGPGFAAHLLGFIGASLLGAMKVSAVGEITREAWDETATRSLLAIGAQNTVAPPSKVVAFDLVDWSRPSLGPLPASTVSA